MTTKRQAHQAVKDCFRHAKAGKPHCYFGDPVKDEDSGRCWMLNFGDTITLSGMTLPLHSDVVACPEHDKMLAEVYGE